MCKLVVVLGQRPRCGESLTMGQINGARFQYSPNVWKNEEASTKSAQAARRKWVALKDLETSTCFGRADRNRRRTTLHHRSRNA